MKYRKNINNFLDSFISIGDSNHSITQTDLGKTIIYNNSISKNLNLPLNATTQIPIGSFIKVYRIGDGVVEITADVGVTIKSRATTIYSKNSYALIEKIDTNTWILTGTGIESLL